MPRHTPSDGHLRAHRLGEQAALGTQTRIALVGVGILRTSHDDQPGEVGDRGQRGRCSSRMVCWTVGRSPSATPINAECSSGVCVRTRT